MEQGLIAAANACGLKIQSNPATYPYGIYTIPEISFTGQTEEQLTADDVPYEVGLSYYRETAREANPRRHHRPVEDHLPPRDPAKFSGVHIIGEGASELLHIGQAVMILKGKIELLRRDGVQLSDSGRMLQNRGSFQRR